MTEQAVLAPPQIFKAYDIRGVHGTEMDESTAHAVGRAFARVLGRLRDKPASELRVGLGRDMRLTSPRMARELRDGLIFEGATVLDAGMIATEILYHLVGSRDLDGGAMVTASHNPKPYTGVKLVREGALALSGDAGIGDVEREIEAGLGPAPGGGGFEEVDIWDEYRARAASFIDPDKVEPMRVVVDGANGMAGPMVGPILERLGLDLVPLYFQPDGAFPDHEPNPLLEENRRMIVERMRGEGADLGIAWDGDADRCFFIDEHGDFCDGDFVCALLARAALRKQPGATVLYDPRSSRAVPDTITASGGRPALSRVGHAFFKARMREEKAAWCRATTTSATSGAPTRAPSRPC
jgi:phosphomannomutase